MEQAKVSQILGLSIGGAVLVAGVIVTHSLVKEAIATRIPDQICLHPWKLTPLCYATPMVLSGQETTAIATSPDGQRLASASGKTIQLWSVQTGKRGRSLNGHTDWVTALAISLNGQTLASSSLDQTIRLWSLKTGKLLATLKAGRVTSLAFSPNGQTLASGSRFARWWGRENSSARIQLWDLGTQKILSTIASDQAVNALAFSPDGSLLAAGAKITKIWHLASGQLLHTLNSGDLNCLVFSQDNQLLITGSDGVQGEDGIKFWQVRSGKQVRVLDSVASDFALSPNGQLLATTYGGTVNLWQMKPFSYLGTLRGSVYSGLLVEFGLNGKVVISGSSDGIRVWQPQPTTDQLNTPTTHDPV
ncbi:MAG: WD40 repeat domain-containing protein [Leptolyngbyaceae cyanobacterium RU_5_1]|nr:WD40 repeat domain-containing protein [Leptolyngbyaceae cyanobacterium RU_5_1]